MVSLVEDRRVLSEFELGEDLCGWIVGRGGIGVGIEGGRLVGGSLEEVDGGGKKDISETGTRRIFEVDGERCEGGFGFGTCPFAEEGGVLRNKLARVALSSGI